MSKQDAATVFVRNLPYDATNEALETHFSEVGPVRRAFIVCDKATKVSRGFGFVSFVLADDAQRAVASLNGKEFKGRRLSIDGAKPGVEVAALGLPKGKKRPADAAASATVAAAGGAAGAAPSSNAHGSSGAARKKTADETGKALRLIVRNLSFRCDEAALRKAFEPHGTVAEVHVPIKADGKHSGFGFVQMGSQAECDAAVAALNETKIVGRVVAVDFSLPKARYEKQQSAAPSTAPAASTPGVSDDGDEDEEDEDEEDQDEEDEDEVEEEDEDEDEVEEEEEPEGEEATVQAAADDDDDDDEDDEDDDDEDEDEDEDEEAQATGGSSGGGAPGTAPAAGETEAERLACTLFMRDLPVQATEVQIRSLLERYGPLRYVTVVRDPATKLSRGTAFACFTDPRAVHEALLSEQSRRPWLLGQQVQLVPATDKASATQAADERRAAASVHKKEGSKRHLELARLGLVQPEEEGAKDLTPAERLKREQAWAEKKEKLSNPNFVVSEFRLSVRNLPTTVDEAQLRKLAYEGALAAPQSAGRPVIKQVKILRDEGRLDRHGLPRSRGFGFVHFESHAHALAALHALSDNPNVLPERRRMLVEFAVDNVQKLKVHSTRELLGAGKLPRRAAKDGDRRQEGDGKGGGKGGGKGEGKGGGTGGGGAFKGAGAGKGSAGKGGSGKGSGGKASPAGAEAEASSEGGGAAASATAFGKLPRGARQRQRAASEGIHLPTAAFSAPEREQQARIAVPTSHRRPLRPSADGTAAEPARGERKRPRGEFDDIFDAADVSAGVSAGGKGGGKRRRGGAQQQDEARFESLVSEYKRKLSGASATGSSFAAHVKDWL